MILPFFHFPLFVLHFSEYEESFRKGTCSVFSWVKPGVLVLQTSWRNLLREKYINPQPLCSKVMGLLKRWWMTLFQSFQDERALSAPPSPDEW